MINICFCCLLRFPAAHVAVVCYVVWKKHVGTRLQQKYEYWAAGIHFVSVSVFIREQIQQKWHLGMFSGSSKFFCCKNATVDHISTVALTTIMSKNESFTCVHWAPLFVSAMFLHLSIIRMTHNRCNIPYLITSWSIKNQDAINK